MTVDELPARTLAVAITQLETAPSFRRVNEVDAYQVVDRTRWTTSRGDAMVALPGDWMLNDGDHRWSVAAAVFSVQYGATDGGRWLKRGLIRAIELGAAMTVPTLEGPASALPGDWLARNVGGSDEIWPISSTIFRRAFVRVDDNTAN